MALSNHGITLVNKSIEQPRETEREKKRKQKDGRKERRKWLNKHSKQVNEFICHDRLPVRLSMNCCYLYSPQLSILLLVSLHHGNFPLYMSFVWYWYHSSTNFCQQTLCRQFFVKSSSSTTFCRQHFVDRNLVDKMFCRQIFRRQHFRRQDISSTALSSTRYFVDSYFVDRNFVDKIFRQQMHNRQGILSTGISSTIFFRNILEEEVFTFKRSKLPALDYRKQMRERNILFSTEAPNRNNK